MRVVDRLDELQKELERFKEEYCDGCQEITCDECRMELTNDYLTLNIPEYLAKEWSQKTRSRWDTILKVGDEIPPVVDAIPVIRCRDCKYYALVPSFTGESQMGCEFFKVYDMYDDDYCSRGCKK